jgi:hypothetical protein
VGTRTRSLESAKSLLVAIAAALGHRPQITPGGQIVRLERQAQRNV